MATRAELKRTYRETPPAMGIILVRHVRSGRFQLHASLNLPGGVNRLRFEITPSTNPNPELRADFEDGGLEAFTIEPLDVLQAKDEPGWTPHDDLAALKALWHARLEAEGGRPY